MIIRLLFTFILGATLMYAALRLTQNSPRYRLERGVLAWIETGKPEEQEILLDTVTGRSWFLTAFDSTGNRISPMWEPIKQK